MEEDSGGGGVSGGQKEVKSVDMKVSIIEELSSVVVVDQKFMAAEEGWR